MNTTYPNIDLSGINPANLVKQELHATAESQFRDYRFIVPKFAPFYVDNFKLGYLDNGTVVPLVEDVDFSFCIPYVTGTRVTGKAMYGAVTLHNLNINGILTMDYQTVGGDQIADQTAVLTFLADKAYNPRTTIWDIITNAPNAFPPSPHYQDYDTVYGQEALVGKLAEIRDAIATNSSLTSAAIRDFLANYGSDAGGFLLRQGDTMLGPLTLSGQPSNPLHAATKQYVDNRISDQSSITELLGQYVKDVDFHFNMDLKLSLSGGIMTGPLSLYADPQSDDQAATKRYTDSEVQMLRDQIQALQDQISFLSNQVNGITKEYVDTKIDEVSARFATYK